MAHDLFQNTMAYVGAIPGETPPWHGLGKLVSADVTAEEMIVAANLDWTVWKEPAPGAQLRTEDPETYDRYLVMREPVGPDEACSVALGMVTSAYEPVQNHEAFAFFEPFIENRWASFSTAGALGNGERIWVMARLAGDIEIAPDDIVERYLLLSTSHHGKGAVSVRFTPIRVVCQNTLNLAMRGGTSVCTIRHTPYVRAHLRKAQAEELRRISEKVFDGAEQRFRAMADRRMQAPEMFAYLDRVFPRTRLQEQRNRTPDSWAAVWRILEDERVTPRGTEDTLWAVYNAVVRYEDYRPTDERLEESRLARVWFGRGRGLKLRALAATKAFLNWQMATKAGQPSRRQGLGVHGSMIPTTMSTGRPRRETNCLMSSETSSTRRRSGQREVNWRTRIRVLPAGALALLLAGCADTTEPPAPRPSAVAVTLSHAEIAALGQTMQLTAEVRDQNGRVMTGAVLAWSSSTAAVASVDASGLVTAASNGVATITATAGEASGTAAVTVEQEATAVTMSTDTATVVKGDTLRLIATALDANGHEVLEAEFHWASLDTLVAVVDQEGLVVGVGPGEVSVMATSLGITGHATVVVKQTADSIVVTPAADTIAPGDTLRLVAQVFDENGNRLEGAQVFWSSSNARLATVDSEGLVTGRGMGGTSTITAKAGEVQGTAQISVHSPDRAALVAFYHAVGGPSSVLFESGLLPGKWLSGPVSTWFGVTTNADGRVTRLDLGDPARERVRSQGLPVFNFFLNGAIPPEIGMLTKLEHLDLSEKDAGARPNSLSGPLPPEIGNLTQLRVLDLHGLSNSFPPEFGNLANLEYLRAYLSSPFPPELDFGNLRSLEHLSLIGYIGSIPPGLGSLPNLEHLSLFGPFGGEIPPELGKAASLEYLRLEGFDARDRDIQRLAGKIPSELGDLTRLRVLYLQGNFEGPIPPSLGNLASLDSLTVSGANLSGLPSELGKLTTLKQMSLSNVSGSIPPQMGNLAGLRSLTLSGTLSGPIPPELGKLTALKSLSLGSVFGSIPPEMGNLASLDSLSLAVSGPIPPQLGNLASLRSLSLAGVSGPIPPQLGNLARLRSLTLSGTLSGPIPPELGKLTALELLSLGDNTLSGPIPSELGSLVAVRELLLANNSLEPPVPLEIGGLPNLTHLDLSGNDGLCYPGTRAFATMPYGGVPDCNQVDQAALRTLYEATGGKDWTNQTNWNAGSVLGEWYGVTADSLGRVVAIDLAETGLRAQLPDEIGALSHLAKLDLSDNRLTGPLPQDLGMLSSLVELRVGDNPELAGRLPMLLTRLGLNVFHYSGTGLCVPIDASFRDWVGGIASHRGTDECVELSDREVLVKLFEKTGGQEWLRSDNWLSDTPLNQWYGVSTGPNGRVTHLHLFGNHLRGRIPPELGDLEYLEWLDLSSEPPGTRVVDARTNTLLGSLPVELGKLSRLRVMNLEWSHGSGRFSIPRSFGDLASLEWLNLSYANLEGRIPPELGRLVNLQSLKLAHNVHGGRTNGLVGPIPPELGSLGRLFELDLSGNDLEGPIPPSFGDLASLMYLDLTSSGTDGELPSELTSLSRVQWIMAGSTGLCVPDGRAFRDWLDGLSRYRIAPCTQPLAYLSQAVQSTAHPVPLVAGEEARLIVFGPDTRSGIPRTPPLQARFYVNGSEIHSERFRRFDDTLIPGHVVRPGLEMVLEIDPIPGFPERIPQTGRLAIEVVEMPLFELTLVPFLYSPDPDSSIISLVEDMAADAENHRMLSGIRTLLPVADLRVTAHEPVLTMTDNPTRLLSEVVVLQTLEGGTGYFMGTMAGLGAAGGVALTSGRSSFSVPDRRTMAHEIGHNLSLGHAPCFVGDYLPVGSFGHFPNSRGRIGEWAYPASGGSVGPMTADLMSYCTPAWISAYHFTLALRHRQRNAAAADREVIGSPAKSLLLWGATDGDGNPYLEPAFVVDAPAALPPAGGAHRLSGWTAHGTELFSLAFDMQEVADGDGSSSFAFVLPVRPGWEDDLASITLTGPGGSTTLNSGSDQPVTILRNPRTRLVRGILRGEQIPAWAAADAAGAGASDLETLFSRGIPRSGTWRRKWPLLATPHAVSRPRRRRRSVHRSISTRSTRTE